MTAAFIICTVLTYGFHWCSSQNVEYPITIQLRNDSPITGGSQLNPRPIEPTSSKESQAPVIIFGLFACVFGAIHCLAWKFPFPTSQENTAWRICSVATTSSSIIIAFIVYRDGRKNVEKKWRTLVIFSLAILYFLGRVAIIVSALMTLRSLPADAFETENWNVYIPHFAT